MSQNVIETEQLTRKYGATVSVNQLNLQVPSGSIYGFLGPNGAGKTTTIRMLLGLIRPTSGTVRVFGQKLSQNRYAILKRVGSLVESPSYYGHLTGYENLAVLATLLDVPKQRVSEMLDVVRLTPSAHRKVKGYSLGMKQRLGIAAALLGNPDLLLLDEPTNGLDPAGIQEIRSLIRSLPRDHGVTVLISSHLLAEVEQVATHVGIINHGKLLFQGGMESLRNQRAGRLEFEVDDELAAQEALHRAKFHATVRDGIVILPYEGPKASASANRVLVTAGRSVYRMNAEQPSLEDLFLNVVGTGESL